MTFNLNMSDSNFGIDLEKIAYDKFGAAIDDFSNNTSLTNTIVQDSSSSESGATGTRSAGITNYAMDLIDVAPKHRFMFKVYFKFKGPYQNGGGAQNSIALAKSDDNIFSFLIKQIDRPSISFEYEEVNYYNYYTKVLKKVTHEPLSMIFYDDIKNHVIDFFNRYRLAYSPIGRIYSKSNEQAKMYQYQGFDFNPEFYSASVGLLEGNEHNMLETITVRQIFAHGSNAVDFVFVNPRILAFDFDEVDHETSQSNGLTVRFDYDSLYLYSPTQQEFAEPVRGSKTDILSNGSASGISTTSSSFIRSVSSSTNSNTNYSSQAGNILNGNIMGNPFIQNAIGKVENSLISAAYSMGSSVMKSVSSIFTDSAKPQAEPSYTSSTGENFYFDP